MFEWLSRVGVVVTVMALFYLTYQYQKKGGRSGKSFAKTAGGITVDLTEKAENGEMDPFSGREEEIERTIHIILRRTKNNPLLIGEPGVGKTAIIEGLAIRIAEGNVPDALKNKRILSLDVNSLVSETKYRGELESRLKALTESLESMEREAILFIDEIHLIEQIGGAEGSLNIGDVLKPALARGEVQIVGATTWGEYLQYIKPNAALDRRFQPVLVDEPNEKQALEIMFSLRDTYEDYHKVKITDEALKAAVILSDKKIKNRFLPDKAIDLIDEAAAKVSIEGPTNNKLPMGVVHAASKAKEGTVDVEDIRDVIDQWVVHSKEEAKRDARQ